LSSISRSGTRSAAAAKNIRQHIDRLANQRNLLLYGNSEGILGVKDVTVDSSMLPRDESFGNLAIYLLIVEYDERQDLVQQSLDAFLKMLGHLPPPPKFYEP
jgi:hypothetical protein